MWYEVNDHKRTAVDCVRFRIDHECFQEEGFLLDDVHRLDPKEGNTRNEN